MTGTAFDPVALGVTSGVEEPRERPVDRAPAGARARLAGLDGMRALAILGVLLYHGDLAWFPGGFLGVDLFFVLSGFLVTALLLEEAGELGGINIPAFYARRLRRLFPALAALLLVLLAVVPFIAPDAHRRTDQDALPALLYAANWWFIFNEGSYFDFIGRPPLLQHLWSLAIEEQFYLLWPCALMLILQVGNRRTVGLVALATALLSTGWMWQLAVLADLPEQGDPSRLYFGTDTHCMGLFVGAALAAFTRPFGNAHRPLPGGLVLARDFLGFAGLAVLVLAFLLIGEQQPALYRGGFLVVACAAAAVLFAVLSPGSLLAWILERPALQWLGQRSYGLYLWHWPVFMLTRPDLDTPLNGVANLVFRLLLVGLIAELSYRLVENPIRNGSFLRLFGAGLGMAAHVRRRLVFGVLIVGAPGVAALVLQNASEHPSPQGLRGHGIPSDIAEAMGIAKGGPLQVTVTPARLNSETINTEGAPTRFSAPAPQPVVLPSSDRIASPAGAGAGAEAEAVVSERPEQPAEIPKPLHPSTAELAVPSNESLTAVGDSVLLGARQQLEQTLPKAQTDAEIGRQAAALLVRLRALKESNLLAGTVMLHLGTNGYVTEKQLREALETLGDRERIILVNARAPRRWVEENNSLIARVVAEYPNAVLADWAGLANDHPEYFVSDGIHLSQAGKRAFVEQILAAAGLSRKATDNAAAADGSVEKEVDARLLTNVGVGQLPEDRQVAECSTGIFWATPEDLVAQDALRLPEPSGVTGLPLFGRRVQVAALNLDLALPLEADALPTAELPASWHCLGGDAGLGP